MRPCLALVILAACATSPAVGAPVPASETTPAIGDTADGVDSASTSDSASDSEAAIPDASASQDGAGVQDAATLQDMSVTEVADTALDSSGSTVDVPAAPSPILLPASTHLLTLQHGAFPAQPGHPSAILYVPEHFDPTPPLDLVVYFHGWHNCVTTCAGDKDQPCTPGGPTRTASHLMSQVEAAHRNVLLLLPEAKVDQPSGADGALGQPGGFAALLTEVLQQMQPTLGPKSLANVGRVLVVSHSGGYDAAADLATLGGVPVAEVALLDSLYGRQGSFLAWIQKDLSGFASLERRFFDVYTDSGGTLTNSQKFAKDLVATLPKDSTLLVHDATTATWAPASYQHGLLFKHSALSHDGVTKYYLQALLASDPELLSRP